MGNPLGFNYLNIIILWEGLQRKEKVFVLKKMSKIE